MGIHLCEIGLCVDPARVVTHLGQRGLQQSGGVALAARAAFRAQPADPERLLASGVLLHQPQRTDHLALRCLQPEVPSLGEQVAPIQLRIRDSLFDDEDLHPQLEQLVKSRSVKVFGPDAAQRHGHDRPFASGPNFRALVPHDHTSSYNAGSWDSSAPSDGTISFSVGNHDWYRPAKQRCSTSSMAGTAVDAPGEPPSRPAIVPSASLSTVVTNSSIPPLRRSRRITCTRWPAVVKSQSESTALGANSRSV